ncbi:GNAT family N-acetyltransferase, partial [Chloroflexota bacterium]
MKIKIVYENGRSVGFIEYIPGESAWRAVNAEDYLVIHCIWVVGRGKKKGYGSRLLNECLKDARRSNKRGVSMVTSSGNWLADKKLLVNNGFEVVAHAPPSFDLLVK